jgi:hypothetical protein
MSLTISIDVDLRIRDLLETVARDSALIQKESRKLDSKIREQAETIKGLTESKSRELELLNTLSDILFIINEDKDGSFFLCEEAAETLNDARELVARVQALRGIK